MFMVGSTIAPNPIAGPGMSQVTVISVGPKVLEADRRAFETFWNGTVKQAGVPLKPGQYSTEYFPVSALLAAA
jgi:hypothetical protein